MTIHRQALQLIEKNKWDDAHRLVQDYADPLSCRIHGHLHRIEGDLSNASYWYHRAGTTLPEHSAEQELLTLWELIQE